MEILKKKNRDSSLVNCRIGSSEKQGQSHEGFDHHATVPVAL